MRGRRGSTAGPVSLLAFQDVLTAVIGIILMLVMILALELGRVKAVVEADLPPSEQLVVLERAEGDLTGDLESITEELERIRSQIESSNRISQPELERRIAETRSERERIRLERNEVERQIETYWNRFAAHDSEDIAAGVAERNDLAARVAQLESQIEEAGRSNRLTYQIAADARQRQKQPIVIEASESAYRIGGIGEGQQSETLATSRHQDRLLTVKSYLNGRLKDSWYVLIVAKPSLSEADRVAIEALCDSLGFQRGLDIVPENWSVFSSVRGAER